MTVMVNKAYYFRIIPNKKQEELINKNIGCVRFVFNYFLEKCKEDKYQSYFKYAKDLTILKKENTWLNEVDSISLQQSLKDLDDAFKRFIKGLAGIPKFKSKKNNKQSYRTEYFKRSSGTESIEIKDNKIKLPKVGWVKFKKSREVKGKIQNVTTQVDSVVLAFSLRFQIKKGNAISRSKTGKYYISVCVKTAKESFIREFEENNANTIKDTEKAIGIDLGLKDFLVTSNGEKIANPKILSKYEDKFAVCSNL